MVPRTLVGRWNINTNHDLSFRVQVPVMNCALNQTYTIQVVDKYHDWPGDEVSTTGDWAPVALVFDPLSL